MSLGEKREREKEREREREREREYEMARQCCQGTLKIWPCQTIETLLKLLNHTEHPAEI